MSDRDNHLLVEDMLDAAEKIKTYCSGYSFDKFVQDERTMDAVIRNFEIIGEAANRIHPDFKAANPKIEWGKMSDFRNRLIHEYFGVDHEIVWQIIDTELEELIIELEGIF